jgi:hypothetical protein
MLRRTRLIDRIAELEATEQRLLAERSAMIAAPVCRPEPTAGPPIHLVTLPKSGSVYLWNVLSKGLGYECDSVSTGCFPRDVADWRKVRSTSAGGVIVQSHLDASRANLQILGHYLPRLQVHLRDPRQATLSMLHHLAGLWKKHRSRDVMLPVQPLPPQEFFEQPLSRQVEWMVEHYLPGCIQWIGEWLAVADGRVPGPAIHITSFEQMLQDEDALLRGTLEFFGIAPDRFAKPARDDAMMAHFRQGTADEWRTVYAPDQQAKAAGLIPDEWKRRFGWRD